MSRIHRGTRDLKQQREVVERWLTLGLGIAVGLSGCFVTYFTELVFHEKLHLIAHVIEHNEGQSGGPFLYSLHMSRRQPPLSGCIIFHNSIRGWFCGRVVAPVCARGAFRMGRLLSNNSTTTHPQQSLNNLTKTMAHAQR